MEFKERTLNRLADLICGNSDGDPHFPFRYRSSSYLSQFFEEADTEYRHDGSTRKWWVVGVLKEILAGPLPGASSVPQAFSSVIARLMEKEETQEGDESREKAMALLNVALKKEGFEAFYAEDDVCYLRHIPTKTVSVLNANPHRPMSKEELERRAQLEAYIESASEDELIEEVLLPLFRHLGFQRITPAGHLRQSPRIRQGHLDEVSLTDFSLAIFWNSGKAREARCIGHYQENKLKRR